MNQYTQKPALQKYLSVASRNLIRSSVLFVMFLFLLAGNGWGQPLLVEDFIYVNGTAITANGWTAHSSGGTNQILVTSPSTISYPGYLSTDIGGEITLVASGEDVNRTFTSQSSGTIYFSFLVYVTSTSTTGDYFFHVSASPLNTSYFRGRIFVKKDVSNNIYFGVAQSSTAANYTATPYAMNTTYLIVLKYEIVAGTTNDVASIYINPPLNAPIPTSGWILNTDAAGNDAANIGSVALRQGTAGNAVGAKLDGIRVATNWADIVGSASSPTLIAIPSTLNGFSYLEGVGPSASLPYSLSGQNLTGFPGDITVSGSTDFEVSTDNSNFQASVLVAYTSETLSATPVYVRLKSGLTLGNYFNETITNAGGGATTINVTCNGAVVLPEPSNHATNFQAGTITSLTIPLTWDDATGGTVPTGYLVKGSATSYAAIAQPVDFTPEANGDFVKNVAAGVGTVTFSGLQPNTAYYFKIWPYTNTGSYIDYKLDGSVPQQSVPTLQLYFRSAASGAWNNSATWEISSDNFSWSPATTEIPVYRTSDVTIKSGHSVTVPISYNIGTAKNLTVENGATLFANSASGSCFVYVFGNILNDGTIGGATDVIGFDIEGASCNLSGSGTFIASRMAKYTNANATSNFTINQNLTLTYTHATNGALYNFLPATTTFNITVAAGKYLTVRNAKINLNGCTLTLNSDITGTASLLDNGITGTGSDYVTVQRQIGAWTNFVHGWHLLSSPVAAQIIDPAFTDPTTANYDFYKWDEITNFWLNQKEVGNGITSFVPGTGYLVAYAASSTKQFNGTLNTANVPVTGLTISGGVNSGWNLVGNPFACALKWNDGINWTAPPEIAGTAKIWDEASAAYVDIAANGIIPAMNGFMVQVLSGSPASLTIPVAARVHDATPWYKSAEGNIKLIAFDRTNNTAQQSIIRINDQATDGYDAAYDSRFLAGYAPEFYSIAGDEFLSTNTLSNLDNGRVIEMGFVKNTATEFSIGLNNEDLIPGLVVYLTDKITSAVTELSQNHEYAFTASEGDDADRFLVHFGFLGIDNPSNNETFTIYSYSGNIYIQSYLEVKSNVMVSNLLGQVIMSSQTNGSGLTTLNTGSLQNGVYLVSVVSGGQVVSRKVSIIR